VIKLKSFVLLVEENTKIFLISGRKGDLTWGNFEGKEIWTPEQFACGPGEARSDADKGRSKFAGKTLPLAAQLTTLSRGTGKGFETCQKTSSGGAPGKKSM